MFCGGPRVYLRPDLHIPVTQETPPTPLPLLLAELILPIQRTQQTTKTDARSLGIELPLVFRALHFILKYIS